MRAHYALAFCLSLQVSNTKNGWLTRRMQTVRDAWRAVERPWPRGERSCRRRRGRTPWLSSPGVAAAVRVLRRRNHDATLPLKSTVRTRTATKRTSTVVLRRCYLARWPGASLRVVCVSPSLPPSRPAHPPTPVLLPLQAPLRVLSGHRRFFHDSRPALNVLARSSGSPPPLPSRHCHSRSYFSEHSSGDMDITALEAPGNLSRTHSLLVSPLRFATRDEITTVVLIPRNKRRRGG